MGLQEPFAVVEYLLRVGGISDLNIGSFVWHFSFYEHGANVEFNNPYKAPKKDSIDYF